MNDFYPVVPVLAVHLGRRRFIVPWWTDFSCLGRRRAVADVPDSWLVCYEWLENYRAEVLNTIKA